MTKDSQVRYHKHINIGGKIMVVVTGGAGFIGSAFIWELNQHGITDILVVDAIHTSDSWKNLVSLQFTDYCDKHDFLAQIKSDDAQLAPISAIIHMGAHSATTETNMSELYENNTHYTKHLCEWAVKKGIYFMYASSAATYGDGTLGFSDEPKQLSQLQPINRYGYSKHAFDLYAQQKDLINHSVGLKFFNVFGPNEYHKKSMRSVACKAFYDIQSDQKVTLFKSHHPDYPHGGQRRDFVYVKDCTRLMWWLYQNQSVSGIFNIGTGQAHSFSELANALFNALNQPSNIHYIDMPNDIRNQYQYFTEAPMTQLKSKGCPVQCRSLDEAISDYVSNYLIPGNCLNSRA
tara:strand:- start:548 stop:1588 length:1041 start_codon:yes stop_codon:yes gene_type:complete